VEQVPAGGGHEGGYHWGKSGGQEETPFLRFRRLTQVPIDQRCIDFGLLRPDHIEWLDAYHHDVWDQLAPLLEGEPQARAWLEGQTRPYR